MATATGAAGVGGAQSGPGAQQEAVAAAQALASGTVVHDDKVGRNDPCPCGSGQKYKRCHGA